MIKYRYIQHHDVSCSQEFCIHHLNEKNQYLVELDGEIAGYLFIDGIDSLTGKSVWKANNPVLDLSATKLGEWIEQTDRGSSVL